MSLLLPEVHGFLHPRHPLASRFLPIALALFIRWQQHSYLVFSVGFEEEHVDDRKVARVSVSFKLLSHPCSESGDG